MAKSALYRLKSSLKEAGAIGPNSRASLSKKDRKKGRPTAASAKNDLNKKLAHIKEAMNPFEMKVTRQKYDILGRKTKGVDGKPTLSKQVGEENVTSIFHFSTIFTPFVLSLLLCHSEVQRS
jgi:nucleolar protein 14